MYLSIDSVHIVNNDVIWENLATVEETLRTKSLLISFMPRSWIKIAINENKVIISETDKLAIIKYLLLHEYILRNIKYKITLSNAIVEIEQGITIMMILLAVFDKTIALSVKLVWFIASWSTCFF